MKGLQVSPYYEVNNWIAKSGCTSLYVSYVNLQILLELKVAKVSASNSKVCGAI
jgi:hypothetical protein